MMKRQDERPVRVGRRVLLAGAGAVALLGSARATSWARSAPDTDPRQAKPAPSPIPGGIDAPPVGFIHWFLPGPTDASTPFLNIPGFGLDVDPSTMTNFNGFTAYAVVSGQAEGSDGKTYNVEFDVRVMDGDYIAEDGSSQSGTFGFF